jgi:hypothetical protein
MSLAGILASSLFSSLGSQMSQKNHAPGSASGSATGAQSIFGALQQKLSAQSSASGSSGASSVPAQMTQLGNDLASGNLTAAQADYNDLKLQFSSGGVSPLHRHVAGQAGNENAATAGAPGQQTNPWTAAMQAYSSLQQNPLNGALNGSLLTNPTTFAVSA